MNVSPLLKLKVFVDDIIEGLRLSITEGREEQGDCVMRLSG